MGEGTVRVLLVDDERSYAEAMTVAIDREDDLECVGVAASVSEARKMAAEHAPDVVLMDVRLPDGNGVDATAAIKADRPSSRVLLLTGDADPAMLARAASAGASGFLLKGDSLCSILDAIRAARDGGLVLRAGTLASILAKIDRSTPSDAALARLTTREREVLALLVSGFDARTIAAHLGMTVNTARSHIKSLLAKLGVHSQLEAVVAAVKAGFRPDVHTG